MFHRDSLFHRVRIEVVMAHAFARARQKAGGRGAVVPLTRNCGCEFVRLTANSDCPHRWGRGDEVRRLAAAEHGVRQAVWRCDPRLVDQRPEALKEGEFISAAGPAPGEGMLTELAALAVKV